MPKLVRITTIPLSLEKLLEGQLSFMNDYFDVIAVSAEKERLEKYGRENGVGTFHVEMTREITPLKDLRAVFRLYRYFKKVEPEIVHTHTPKAGIVGMLAAKMAGVPIRLHTVAGMPLMETVGIKRKILEQVEKFTYSLAYKVYPNSHGLKEIILKEGFVKKGKLKVLGKGSSNGIDTVYFDPDRFSAENKTSLRKAWKIPEDDLVFIFVGRLVSEKGISELVCSFQRLQLQFPKMSLLLVGPFEEELDPLSPSIHRIIEKHPKITVTGYQVDVRPFLAISDILAFPSYREGFPNVVMQAGAMELPSIVSDINGCNEIISDGINGIVIPVKNEKSLFKAMEKLVADEKLRMELSKNSREKVCKDYERKEFWHILLKEYKTLEQEITKA
ncbi:glycosyltransferase family 4 protein [Salinimicrobium sediminilitoris]|uniref:glycosyltransferase family 4 protein n=1 Tax=Salinimicrobium sediminilitoris TaxID=2876715 RepID=UPI001E4CEB29|nr:glycosyltransferase family 4 protein [Salinimicrobium sediminilitoris]MCC8358733.1 glycosyltransferase family 4 protein [Salinimicrobium sediminilitoris]